MLLCVNDASWAPNHYREKQERCEPACSWWGNVKSGIGNWRPPTKTMNR